MDGAFPTLPLLESSEIYSILVNSSCGKGRMLTRVDVIGFWTHIVMGGLTVFALGMVLGGIVIS